MEPIQKDNVFKINIFLNHYENLANKIDSLERYIKNLKEKPESILEDTNRNALIIEHTYSETYRYNVCGIIDTDIINLLIEKTEKKLKKEKKILEKYYLPVIKKMIEMINNKE